MKLDAFKTDIEQAIHKLPRNPWNHIVGEVVVVDAFRFICSERGGKDGRITREWELLSEENKRLSITAWHCYSDGVPADPEVEQSLTITEDGTSKGISTPVMIIDGTDDSGGEKHAEEVNQSFGIKPFYWKDIELAPFAIDREGDWQRHREAMNEPPLGEIIRNAQAMLNDALRVLWFCAHEPREWLSIPSMIRDDEGAWARQSTMDRALMLEDKIRTWSRDNVANNEQAMAVSLFYEIFQSAYSTKAVPKPSEHSSASRAKN